METPERLAGMAGAWSDIDLLALDADDTLWHHERYFSGVQETVRELLSPYVSAEVLDERLLATERRNLKVFGYGVKGFGLSLIETAIEVTEGRVSSREIEAMLELVRELMTHPIDLLPGVAEALDRVGGRFELALVTKGDLFHQEAKIAASGLAERFEHVAIVSEKDRSTYEGLFTSWGVQPDSIAMVGNSISSDVEPVLEAGARAAYVPSGYEWALDRAPLPDGVPVLESLEDLIYLLF
ncbi:MAG: HAD family hydrolase [Actinomycetia bacterium]|nr:HAD family hydrolase [Actinomycetes bacterium]MCP4959357.1 HAD family hydrolase [Actinomycetes bacterium]